MRKAVAQSHKGRGHVVVVVQHIPACDAGERLRRAVDLILEAAAQGGEKFMKSQQANGSNGDKTS